MNKQQLSHEQRQTLTARQIMQVKLLELPVAELRNRIEEELIANPALEQVVDDNDDKQEQSTQQEEQRIADDYLSEDDIPEYKLRIIEAQQEQRGEIPYPSDSISLQQYLREQLAMMQLSEKEATIAEQIIGNIGDDGYLRAKSREVEDYLLFNEGIACSPEEYLTVLKKIQQMEPAGVAARDLQETLLLQLQRLPATQAQQDAKTVVDKFFEDLGNRRYERILQRTKFSEQRFKDAHQLILTLNPKPGNGYGSEFSAVASRIVPDFIVRAMDDGFEVWLNEEGRIPKLRLSPGYTKLTQAGLQRNREEREQKRYAREQVSHAKWFIEAIENRRNTLLRTMEVMVSLQEEFFRTGDVKEIKPMILQDVATRTGNDVSTVSRISNEKYLQCDFGIYPLKFFFSEGSERQDGELVSTRGVKSLLEELIASEDKRAPLTDEKLAKQMAERGFPLARRTLAKYREQLGILPARLRRKL